MTGIPDMLPPLAVTLPFLEEIVLLFALCAAIAYLCQRIPPRAHRRVSHHGRPDRAECAGPRRGLRVGRAVGGGGRDPAPVYDWTRV